MKGRVLQVRRHKCLGHLCNGNGVPFIPPRLSSISSKGCDITRKSNINSRWEGEENPYNWVQGNSFMCFRVFQHYSRLKKIPKRAKEMESWIDCLTPKVQYCEFCSMCTSCSSLTTFGQMHRSVFNTYNVHNFMLLAKKKEEALGLAVSECRTIILEFNRIS